ncbi:hypothetical protein C7S18_19535 [Ahniella affigens]|uniref:YdhG-like domain-containing protein n=1 Tax=Ahniella affigens TaxID=2021234 RepID=A0A2P1PZC6_9GAMM|nr:hypothetical protein C7S18_19535 [Ahniella affigens]
MPAEIDAYNAAQDKAMQPICALLAGAIDQGLPDAESRIWHAHPVWFLDGNPIVGYSRLKGGVRLLFWSGQTFSTPGLQPEGKFKAAEARFTTVADVDTERLRQWLQDGAAIQWDYKNIVRRKGRLERLK